MWCPLFGRVTSDVHKQAKGRVSTCNDMYETGQKVFAFPHKFSVHYPAVAMETKQATS